jgi:hypothetical protein
MADYIITPDKNELPSSYMLAEELHRRALAVEMKVKGTNYQWESINFFDPLLPQMQCFLEKDSQNHIYKISIPAESTQGSSELQAALAEILLHEIGGNIYDPVLKESFDLKTFKNRSKETHLKNNIETTSALLLNKPDSSLPPFKDMLWIVFSWALVLLGVYFYRHALPSRKLFMFIACALALISAGGITFSATQSK